MTSDQEDKSQDEEKFSDFLNSGCEFSKNLLMWEQGNTENYVCCICKKTFYNLTALQNHKNIQHDQPGGCNELDMSTLSNCDQTITENFSFFPRIDPENAMNQTTVDGITTRTFTQDTSYIIVRMEGEDCVDNWRSYLEDEGNCQEKKNQYVDVRGPFTCTFPSSLRPDVQCKQIFVSCCDYSLHYREEHTKRRKAALRCQVCEKRLEKDPSKEDYEAALFELASSKPIGRLTCGVCMQSFLDRAQYEEHNRIVHAKTKPHMCPICSKRFTLQGGLQQHMRMHTGIRPFTCSFCSKAFSQKAGLDQHLRTHTKIKPFRCVICSKCFSQSVHLRQHMRTHTNIQPFACIVCGKRFKQSSHLKFHMRCHLGSYSHSTDNYPSELMQRDQIEFLNLTNLQPVQYGETLYYAADLVSDLSSRPNIFM